LLGFPVSPTATNLQFDTIGRPRGDAAPKEVLIFRPDRNAEQNGNSYYGPVLDIASAHPLLARLARVLDTARDLLAEPVT
jgi:hypothetical protein